MGHLLQGRFQAILLQRKSYLLELCRYVVLNPMRAQFVSRPEEWRWSSYFATAGLKRSPDLLTVTWVLNRLPEDKGGNSGSIGNTSRGDRTGKSLEAPDRTDLGNTKFLERFRDLLEES